MNALQLDTNDKATWLQNLRSGNFEQAKGFLRVKGSEEDGSNDEFCCLGLFVEQLDPERWCGVEHMPAGASILYATTDYDEYGGEISGTAEGEPEGDMYDLMGLDCDSCAILMGMNDGTKYAPSPGADRPAEEIVIVDGIQYLKSKRPHTFSEIADYIEVNL